MNKIKIYSEEFGSKYVAGKKHIFIDGVEITDGIVNFSIDGSYKGITTKIDLWSECDYEFNSDVTIFKQIPIGALANEIENECRDSEDSLYKTIKNAIDNAPNYTDSGKLTDIILGSIIKRYSEYQNKCLEEKDVDNT